jgi:hypothetical protein
MINTNWVEYIKDVGFSDSFKNELEIQLRNKLTKYVKIENNSKLPIDLVFGLVELNREIKNNFCYASANIYVHETDQMLPIKIRWTTKKLNEITLVSETNMENVEVVIEWCEDFPNIYTSEIETKDLSNFKTINNLKYQITADLYPDLNMYFSYKLSLTELERQRILKLLLINKKIYVSEFKGTSILIDFQIDLTNHKAEDTKKDIDFLEDVIEKISKFKFINKINYIEIY